jgi:hypothetical protein
MERVLTISALRSIIARILKKDVLVYCLMTKEDLDAIDNA